MQGAHSHYPTHAITLANKWVPRCTVGRPCNQSLNLLGKLLNRIRATWATSASSRDPGSSYLIQREREGAVLWTLALSSSGAQETWRFIQISVLKR